MKGALVGGFLNLRGRNNIKYFTVSSKHSMVQLFNISLFFKYPYQQKNCLY